MRLIWIFQYVCVCVLKDGAYLVRDSVRQLAGQPFTLMVFYQEKVYNIQIRQQNHQFLLGTGLKVQEVYRTPSPSSQILAVLQKLVRCLKPLLNSLLVCVCAAFPLCRRHHLPLLPVSSPTHWCQEKGLEPAEPVSPLWPGWIFNDGTELDLRDTTRGIIIFGRFLAFFSSGNVSGFALFFFLCSNLQFPALLKLFFRDLFHFNHCLRTKGLIFAPPLTRLKAKWGNNLLTSSGENVPDPRQYFCTQEWKKRSD